ncbi:hypothetical protein EJD97_010788 [Solanum chilense]|uniref:S-protein homolog n=1 Tax=Solanum chilense TaxID=4083 RepID=A0A6N2BGY2_SOLCI|nr:hypothetical protein EJD97_010788 [Solanum chilense]
MNLSMFNIFFFLLLLISPLDLSLARHCVVEGPLQVHIINKLPPNGPPLKLHCAAKDTDLGEYSPAPDEDFNWSFCELIGFRTLYYCHFWWYSKVQMFDVYSDPYTCIKGQTAFNFLEYCKWEVRENGFFLEQYNETEKAYHMNLLYDWS